MKSKNSHDGRQPDVLDEDQVRTAVSRALGGAPPVDVDEAWRRLDEAEPVRQRGLRNLAPLRLAAVVALAILAYSALVTVSMPWRSVGMQASPTGVTVISLDDGSTVQLAPGSYVETRGRRVALHGTARFQVEDGGGRSFQVQTDRLQATVLGTDFVVRTGRVGAPGVAVREGRVRVSSREAEVEHVLSAGEGVLVGPTGELTPIVPGHLPDWFAWTEGRLSFTDRPFAEVLSELSLWYDVRLTTRDPQLAEERVSLTVAGESLQELIQLLSLLTDARADSVPGGIKFVP